MCMIIDANRLKVFLRQPDNDDMVPIHKWLERNGKIVYSTGDKLSTEIPKFDRQRLQEYVRNTNAIFIPDNVVAEEAQNLRESELPIKSDDQHVLALARLSKVRLLFSYDQDLQVDFKNTKIVPSPKGRIYKGKQHKQLLTNTVCRRLIPST